MRLTERTRQSCDKRMTLFLEDIENGQPCTQSVDILMSLCLKNLPIDKQEEVKKKSTYIVATHDDKNEHNSKQLSKLCSDINPLAFLKYVDVSGEGKKCVWKHYATHRIPMTTFLCVGAKVAIKGKKFKPSWGLYNGAIGTVNEIVFKPGDNPNCGDLPVYVAVEFQSYNPPSIIPCFDHQNPKVINILNALLCYCFWFDIIYCLFYLFYKYRLFRYPWCDSLVTDALLVLLNSAH